MKNKRQHVIPRAYLSRFVDPSTPNGQEPFLWVIARATDPKARAPKKVAVKSHYYSIANAEGVLDDGVDKLLQSHENGGLPVLKLLQDGADPAGLTPHEKAAASRLVASFGLRVPAFRDMVERSTAEIARKSMQIAASHPQYFRQIADEIAADGGEPLHDTEGLRHAILSGKFELATDPAFSLEQMVRLIEPGAKYAFNFNWRVLTAPEGETFVTSNRPFVQVPTVEQPRWMGYGAGWLSPWMEATLPLGPSALLLISQHVPAGREVTTAESVLQANRRTAFFATEVYSSTMLDPMRLNIELNGGWPWTPLSEAIEPEFLPD